LVQQPGDVAGQQRNLDSILGRDERCFSSQNIKTTSQAINYWAPRDLSPDAKQLITPPYVFVTCTNTTKYSTTTHTL